MSCFFLSSYFLFLKMTSQNVTSQNKEQGWYEDRYISILIQRNFLILFTTFISLGLLICLVIIKNIYDGNSVEPYILEYDKATGIMTVVESQSKKEYTAQQAIKESLLTRYVENREGINLSNIEETMNYTRVMSHPQIYDEYVKTIGIDLNMLRETGGKIIGFKTELLSITYFSATKVDIKFVKYLIADNKILSTRKFKASISFGFVDLEASVEDLRLNPLGFQVSYYRVIEEKTLEETKISNDQSIGNAQNSNNNVKAS